MFFRNGGIHVVEISWLRCMVGKN